MLRGPWNRVLRVLAVGVLAAACQPDAARLTGLEDALPAGSDRSGLTLLLTDAPGDILAAVVTITEIYLQGQGGRVVLRDEPFTTDLLTLRDDVAVLVQDADVPPGRYAQLRLVLSGAYLEVETETGSRIYATAPDYAGLPDGAAVGGILHTPSMQQTGIKVILPGGALDIDDGHTILLIDFDVAESFGRQAGLSGRWIMHPVVRATDVTFAGHVLARVQLDPGVELPEIDGEPVTLADFRARLTPAGNGAISELPLSGPDGDGVFQAMFKGLAPGEYSLEIVPPDGVTVSLDPEVPVAVTVIAGATTTVTFTVVAAEATTASVIATLRLDDEVTLPEIDGEPVTLADFTARLTPADDGDAVDLAFAGPDDDGDFHAPFHGLTPGTYSLAVLPPDGVSVDLDPPSPVEVEVDAGETVNRVFLITDAEAS